MRISRWMTGIAGLVVALGLASGAAAAVPAANGGNSDEARAEHQRIVDFWTNDKVAQAKPRDFIRDRATGEFTLATEVAIAPVAGSSWAAGGEVQRTTGKVLFAVGRSYYVCSASVVTEGNGGRSIILTAGHCVYDNRTGKFATNWMFVPDYDSKPVDLTTNGAFCSKTTYGCWTATSLVVHRGFASQRQFNTQATLYDFAFAVVGAGGTSGTAQLDVTVGSQEIAYGSVGLGTDTYLFGYPAASPYTGKDLVYSEGPLGNDPLNNNLTYRVTSNMTGGSSGGPWFSAFSATTGQGTMMSVNSYGYSGTVAMHGPMFNSNTTALFTAANASVGNKVVG